MTDREKVVKGLEQCQGECLEPSNGKCPYYPETHGDRCFNALLSDALALLKAQEPRVMTLKDFDGNPERDQYGNLPCWLESKEPLVANGWNRWNEDDFIRPQMRNFRPWTSRPTDEQREATPWQ